MWGERRWEPGGAVAGPFIELRCSLSRHIITFFAPFFGPLPVDSSERLPYTMIGSGSFSTM